MDGPRWHSTWPSPPAMTRAEYPVGGSWRTGSLARPKWGGMVQDDTWARRTTRRHAHVRAWASTSPPDPGHKVLSHAPCRVIAEPSLWKWGTEARNCPRYWSHLAQAETANYALQDLCFGHVRLEMRARARINQLWGITAILHHGGAFGSAAPEGEGHTPSPGRHIRESVLDPGADAVSAAVARCTNGGSQGPSQIRGHRGDKTTDARTCAHRSSTPAQSWLHRASLEV